MSKPVDLPLFPLSSIVMPEGLLPLRLFELRYIDMVKNCFKTETGFGVCLSREKGSPDDPDEPYPQGTHVKIIDFDQGSDGLLHIMAKGVEEFVINDYAVSENGLLMGDVTMLPPQSMQALDSEYAGLASKLEMILRYVETHISYPEEQLDDAGWVCNRLLELLPLDAEAKFDILQMPTLAERLDALNALHFTIESSGSST